jgi:hypothetical protein
MPVRDITQPTPIAVSPDTTRRATLAEGPRVLAEAGAAVRDGGRRLGG